MEKRKLTKQDIDKVRNIEGFPIGIDEDIIALSDAPYYTACPNPFIEEFIQENGHPYDEETDDYQCEPFTAEVSEGKHDPMYMAHSYHTKVPYKAIAKYILHYTKPGDIVFDGFSGSGMTGVAAQLCCERALCLESGLSESETQNKIGSRFAIINDLSPEASFIGYNYNTVYDRNHFLDCAEQIIRQCYDKCAWVYKTKHVSDHSFLPGDAFGIIDYVVWSDMFICPNCGEVFSLWDISVLPDNQLVKKPTCPRCKAIIDKNKCERVKSSYFDKRLDRVVTAAIQKPVKVFYTYNGKRFSKTIDETDNELLKQIEQLDISTWYPVDELPAGFNTEQPKKSHGYYHVHQFYTKRNLFVLSSCFDFISKIEDNRLKHMLMFWFSSIYSRSHKLNRYMPNHNRHVGPLSGTLYVPYFQAEINILNLLQDKLTAVKQVRGLSQKTIITTQSSGDCRNIPDNSVDYIFTDPPFGDNLNYSELNFIWESWLKVKTNNEPEAVVNAVQHKTLESYQDKMTACLGEYYRVLKPNRWITIEFHNSKNAVWNAIQESINRVGFVIADVRTLDKQKGTTKQLSYTTAVQQDLVISAYKPIDSFTKDFKLKSGTEKAAWSFVRQHLKNVPITVKKGGQLEVLSERQAFMLWDRMVAYHIMHGIAVPMDAADFYKGLDDKYIKRDGMYFLPNQVNKYDAVRATCEVENIQFSLFVSDEKTAIGWLYQQLDPQAGGEPQTYQDLSPKFMQELKAVDKREKMPELMVILEENFLKDDKGRWYIPDYTKSGDIAKLREKNLLKEFAEYQATKGKLKIFRSEAIRAGFAKLWKDKDYSAIVAMAERLPEETIQEDSNLLMYYDISLSRAQAAPTQIGMDLG